MTEKKFRYSLMQQLNFMPGLMLFGFLIYTVVSSISDSQMFWYAILLFLFALFLISVLDEKKRVAKEIVMSDKGILARRWLWGDVFVQWGDVISAHKQVVNWEIRSKRIRRTNYFLVITSSDNTRITIKKSIQNYDDLVSLIELKTGRKIDWGADGLGLYYL